MTIGDLVHVETFALPLSLDLSAVALGSLQGAMFAAGFKKIDVLGVAIIGIAAGLGGGILRDLLLGTTPATLQTNWYLVVAVSGALLGMLLGHVLRKVDGLITLLDALSIGMYGALGTTKALAFGLPIIPALFVGTVAAVGGGALRDVFLTIPISVLQVGSLYAIAALIGNISIIACLVFGLNVVVSGIAGVVITTLIRLFAVWFGWSLPEQRTITLRRERHEREVEETFEALLTGSIDLSQLRASDDDTDTEPGSQAPEKPQR